METEEGTHHELATEGEQHFSSIAHKCTKGLGGGQRKGRQEANNQHVQRIKKRAGARPARPPRACRNTKLYCGASPKWRVEEDSWIMEESLASFWHIRTFVWAPCRFRRFQPRWDVASLLMNLSPLSHLRSGRKLWPCFSEDLINFLFHF